MDPLRLSRLWLLDSKELRRVMARAYWSLALCSVLLLASLLWFWASWSRAQPSLSLLASSACWALLLVRAIVRLRRARRHQQMRFLAMVQQGLDGQSRNSQLLTGQISATQS